MSETAQTVTEILALGTIGMQIASVLLLGVILFQKRLGAALSPVLPYALPLAFALTLAGSLLTLVYSEVFGMIPCFLCWIQRAFLYPMPVLLGIAMVRNYPSVWKHVLLLSMGGAIVAYYQHYLQMGGASLVACPALPGAEDCAQRLIFEFGYVTFPLMAVSIFVLVGLVAVMKIRQDRAH